MVRNVLDIHKNRIAVIMPTLRCNIACEHCIMSCTPGSGETMSKTLIESITEQFIRLDFNTICLTGGEPLLCPELVRKVSEICLLNRKALIIQTNGFWASTPDAARKSLRNIPYITQLGFSFDQEHAKFISRSSVENGIRAAYDNGIDNVSISISYQTEKEREELYQFFKSRYPKLEIAAWPITPLGRAKDNSKLQYTYEKHSLDCHPRGCEVQKNFSPIVTPSGNLHLCYHLTMLLGHSDPFFAGNIFKKPLKEILNNVDNPIFDFVMAFGGGSLGYLVREIKPEVLQKKYQRTCEFCYEVLSDQVLVEQLKEMLSYQEFQNRIQEVFSFLKNQTGSFKTAPVLLQVCDGENCFSKNQNKHLRYFLMNRLLDTGKYNKVGIECVKCFGQCETGPNVMVKDTDLMIHHADTEKLDRLINSL